MTKRELVVSVSQQLNYKQGEVAEIVQVMLDSIVEYLANGERLEFRNFGVFQIHSRPPRQGRNPRTGESVSIAEKRVVTFKPGKALKEYVEQGDPTAAMKSDD